MVKIPQDVLQDLFSRRGVKPGLKRIKKLLKIFGVGKIPFKVIHVAGTNGKGSCAVMTARILEKCGKKVGLFTSPHLIKVNERISVNKKNITDKDFLKIVKKIYRTLWKSDPKTYKETTFFEMMTLISILYFIAEKVDFAVYETGMGGRLDATNVFPSKVCIVTDISKEHTEFLGSTISLIAREKFAICKKGSKCVTSVPEKLTSDTLRYLNKSKSTVYFLGKDFKVKLNKREKLSLILHYKDGPGGVNFDFSLATPIKTQMRNAGLAIKASFEIIKKDISKEDFVSICKNALQKCLIPARFQIMEGKTLNIVDVAHNPAGTEALVTNILRLDIRQEWCIIFGVLKDKNFRRMFCQLKRISKDFIFVSPESERGVAPIELKRSLRKHLKNTSVQTFDDMKNALRFFNLRRKNKNLLVCGSFTIAGPFLREWKRM